MKKETAPTIESARTQLLRWGSVAAVIYAIYLFAFPLNPYIQHEGSMLDIEMILRNDARWFIWVYIIGLLILFYAFWRMVKTVHELSRQNAEAAASLRKLILGISIACGFILLGLYPITAIDVALYVVRARLWTLYNGNPLTALPEAYPQDPYIAIAGEFGDETSPYGPLWELIAQVPMHMGLTDIASGVAAMKVIALMALIGMAWLIGWKAKTVSGATALAFFALNPLVLLEAIGNGHNDILMLAFITWGLILWQKNRWMWAMTAFTLATMIKITGVIIIPLFGLAALMDAPNWNTRLKRGFGLAVVFCSISLALYGLMGPLPDVFTGTLSAMFSRRSASVPYALYVIVREFNLDLARGILTNSKFVFMAVYAWLAIAMLRKKINLLEAGFLAYLAQIILSNAFRIWYPLWLIPFAALNLNSQNYWRTFLFSLTAEFSILSYYILWRWHWRDWEWGLNGPLTPYWNFWTIMTPFTVSWTFTIPFFGDIIHWLRKPPKVG
jgi:hypothetical protein